MSKEQLSPEISKILGTETVEEFIKNSEFLNSIRGFAENAHKGQFRESGEPYFSHCIEVARILYEEWGIKDEKIIGAALLHDTTEDTDVTLDTIKEKFGKDIAFWVDGVSKLRSERGVWTKEQGDKETLKKVFDKTLDDPVVAVLKLADRTHNMRTLTHLPPDKQRRKANETLNIYAKLAESLGMWKVMRELEDISYKYVYPDKYKKYLRARELDPRTNDNFVANLKSVLQIIADESGVNANIDANINSLAKIEKKKGSNPIRKINDFISFRVVINGENKLQTRNDVGKMFMAVRDYFGSIEDQKRLDDFYSNPKKNGYSTIQLTLDFPQGSTEVAITSAEKEEFNNWGVVSLIKKGQKDLQEYALKLVFTPTGTVKFFPLMATGVDFAYSINEEMGRRAEKILINGVEHPISTVLPNGADVRVALSKKPRIAPSRDLLNYSLPSTRQIINEQINEKKKFDIEKTGKEKASSVISELGIIDLEDVLKIDKYEPVLKTVLLLLGCKGSLEDLYYKIGAKIIVPEKLKASLMDAEITKEKMGITSILIEGVDDSGINAYVSTEIAIINGIIGPFTNVVHEKGHKKTFVLRIVANDIDKDGENRLKHLFEKDQRFNKVIII